MARLKMFLHYVHQMAEDAVDPQLSKIFLHFVMSCSISQSCITIFKTHVKILNVIVIEYSRTIVSCYFFFQMYIANVSLRQQP